MKQHAYLFFSGTLLVAFIGCGSNKPETVPAKVETPSAEKTSSPTVAESRGKPSSSPANPAPEQPQPPIVKAPASPQPLKNEEVRDLTSRLFEKTPQSARHVNEAVTLKLEQLGDGATDDLVTLLGDAQPDARRGAAYFLLAFFKADSEKQVAGYTALLDDNDPFIRSLALQAVRKMQTSDQVEALPRLVKMLAAEREPKPENRASLARFLGSLKERGAPALEPLQSAAKADASPAARGACLMAISQIASNDAALPAFRQGLKDQDAAVRLVAAARLRQLGKDAAPAAEDLAAALEDSSEGVRTASAEALIMLGAAAVEPVSKQVDSKKAHTRQLAIACLGKLGADAKSALPVVEKHLTDEDPEVKKVAEAVAKILKGS